MKCKLYLPKCFALFIVLLLAGGNAFAQSRTVQGTVTDASGPVIGVTVMVQGTSTGTTSGADGSYSIRVADNNAVLEFNFLGYQPVVIPVEDRTRIDVTLQEDTQNIDEVVVIGYGTMRKRDLTGSVASVGGEEIAAIPVSNVAQALQGKIAGVTITSQDGRPDAGIKIRVRGGGSITQSNEPLYVVDGFPVNNINDIPATQIESISILKDASSTAIYGSRGANGVVLVTTKAPSKERITVSYDGYMQIKRLANDLDLMDGPEYVKFNWELYNLHASKSEETYRQAFALGQPGTQAFLDGINAYGKVKNTDWLKELYGNTAYAYSHNVNISGGNEKTRYTVSYNNMDNESMKINSWYKRNNVSARLNTQVAKNLTFDIDTRFTDVTVFGNSSSTNSAVYYAPVAPLGEYDSEINPGFVMESDNVNPAYAPDKIDNDTYNKRYRKNLRINASLTWQIINGLTFKTEYGKSYGWTKIYDFKGLVVKHTDGYPEATIERNETETMRFVNTLNWQVQGLGDNHRLDVLLGHEMNEYDQEKSKMKAPRMSIDMSTPEKAFGNINMWEKAMPAEITNSYDVPYNMVSFFGRVNYTFKDRYIFTATLRADGSSKFAKSEQWGYFPAAAAAWRINAEPFLQSQTWIDNLKLRVSYGEAGNDRIDGDLYRQTWVVKDDGYSFGNVRQPYYEPTDASVLYNKLLHWETTITRNAGLDFALFNNRLYGTIEGYWNTTKSLLIRNSITQHTGYTIQQQNIGQTRNTGLEVSLGGDIIRKKDFLLSANFNIGFNKSKIEKLAPGNDYMDFASAWGSTTITPYYDYKFQVGQQVGLIMGYITDGFYTVDDFDWSGGTPKLNAGQYNSVVRYQLPAGVAGSTTAAYPGALKLKKLADDSDKDITTNDITVIGNTNPKHTGGFNLNAVYKGFDAAVGFNWSYGNDIYNANKLDAASMTQNKVNVNLMSEMTNRFRLFDELGNRVTDPNALRELNKNATIWYPYQNTRVVHSWGIEDGSFLRLNNVTLGYTLPESLTKKIYISRLRIYVSAQNVWTWTDYSGLDPEVDGNYIADKNADNKFLTPGLDWNAYPRARTFTFGINLTF